ncbi:anthranilate phosphoribosyltransferase [Salsuginibacillus kocurii]|uniref:anthranilate phosphoribosyltransferase n=1 Tax=Salsuginibacillus kocurii TaxID=427078 RepID=UPI00036EFF14|nr:hypothetical protein [Salsuginibacillus kocurii]
MKPWLKEVARGETLARPLTYRESYEVAASIATGEATDAQIGAFLVAKRLKGETWEEMQGFVDAFRDYAALLSAEPMRTFDAAGPYDGRKTFAATIPVSFLLAAAGHTTYLHGGPPLPPKYGTPLESLLSRLGGKITEGIMQKDAPVTFVNSSERLQALARLHHVREEIGVRSFLNTVEKLLGLLPARTLLFGVFHKKAAGPIIELAKRLPYEEAFIVQGEEGAEDVPVHRKQTFIYHVTAKQDVETLQVEPGHYGFSYHRDDFPLYMKEAEHVERIETILEGDAVEAQLEPLRDQVLFNTGLRLYLIGDVPSVGAGIEVAKMLLESGSGARQLEDWRNHDAGRQDLQHEVSV